MIKIILQTKQLHQIDKIIKWCNDNCKGLWYLDNISFVIYFYSERDCLMFELKWG